MSSKNRTADASTSIADGAHADRKDPVLGGEPIKPLAGEKAVFVRQPVGSRRNDSLDFIRALQWRARSVTPGSIGVPLQCRSDPTLGDDRRHARNPRIAPDPPVSSGRESRHRPRSDLLKHASSGHHPMSAGRIVRGSPSRRHIV
jgi:hypothetical protein